MIQSPAKEHNPMLNCACHQKGFPTSWRKAPLSVSLSSQWDPSLYLCVWVFPFLPTSTSTYRTALHWSTESSLGFLQPLHLLPMYCHPHVPALGTCQEGKQSLLAQDSPCKALSWAALSVYVRKCYMWPYQKPYSVPNIPPSPFPFHLSDSFWHPATCKWNELVCYFGQ